MATSGRAAIQGESLEVLRHLVSTKRGATLVQLCADLRAATGISVTTVTLHATLKRMGLDRVKARRPAGAGAKPGRYGYGEHHRVAGDDRHFATDMTDAEWALIADLFDLPPGSRGRPSIHPRRTMVDACVYVLRTGCAWTMLPKTFAPWRVVHKTFSRWSAQGKFEQVQARLAQQWRERIGKDAQPTAAVIDSQSNRISPQGGESGFDAGKKVKGRKRHLVVDTLGLLLAVSVTAASVQDRAGATTAIARACARHPNLTVLFADSAYAGKCAQALSHDHGITVEIVRKPSSRGEWDNPQASLWPESTGFTVLPKRWVVERTHSWLERSRRLVMHHDRSPLHAQTWAWMAQVKMLVDRLTR